MFATTYVHLKALALALALANDATPQTASAACDEVWEQESDSWWDCHVALETWRCERQGWCSPPDCIDDEFECIPPMEMLPDPARPGLSFTTNWRRRYHINY